MENYMKYIKQYGGYVLAVGAGCTFGVNLWLGFALLAGAAGMAYCCCGKDGCNYKK